MSKWKDFGQALIRRKIVNINTVTETKLSRCLNTFDLTFLGVGSTLGAGIYVVAGQVAKDVAGPAVILSFLVAALASVLAGLCYAEFGARVPKTGSAYVYSYVTVGEFVAFVIGWNLILEYVIGTSSVARATSVYLDSLIGNPIHKFLQREMPMNAPGLSPYPDFFAVLLVFALTVILAIGVKETSTFNTIFTCLNLFVVVYVIICGFFKIDVTNWQIARNEVPNPDVDGTGGFFPFGVSGMLSGAATCFFAFVGFDIIATTGEEVKNPSRAIPTSIVASLTIISLSYIGISSILTLIIPYYHIDPNVPIPDAFDKLGYTVARYVVAVGAVAALSASLLGAMFPMPRIIYAMAEDGIIFTFLSRVHERLKTPLIATIISGILAGAMACLFDLKELVNMMSIGTLLAYTLVAECILLLRYRTDETLPEDNTSTDSDAPFHEGSSQTFLQNVLSLKTDRATNLSMTVSTCCIVALNASIVGFCLVIIFAEAHIVSWWAIILAILTGSGIAMSFFIISFQPQNRQQFTFKMPLVPLLPCLSIFVNTYLMLKLPTSTWIRFGVWMAIGLLVYFGYGIRHARARNINSDYQTNYTYEAIEDPGDTDGSMCLSHEENFSHTTNTSIILSNE